MDNQLLQLVEQYAKAHHWAEDSTCKECTIVALRRLAPMQLHAVTPPPVLVALAAFAGQMEVYERTKQRSEGALPSREAFERTIRQQVLQWFITEAEGQRQQFVLSTVRSSKNALLFSSFLLVHGLFRKTDTEPETPRAPL